MLAFLHCVANAGGVIVPEYAIGMGRIELYMYCGMDRFAYELKVWRDGEPDPLPEVLALATGEC